MAWLFGPGQGLADSICGRTCLLANCPWGRLRLLEGLKVHRGDLAEDARGGQGIVRVRVRLVELELISVGDALARLMLTAAVADLGGARASAAGIPLSWSSDVTVPAAARGSARPGTGGRAW